MTANTCRKHHFAEFWDIIKNNVKDAPHVAPPAYTQEDTKKLETIRIKKQMLIEMFIDGTITESQWHIEADKLQEQENTIKRKN